MQKGLTPTEDVSRDGRPLLKTEMGRPGFEWVAGNSPDQK
jgi:hypothetical protein